jgi:hypothetical protein
VRPDSFELLGDLRQIEIIASGRGVHVSNWLKKRYGGNRWRKMKGIALIREDDGEIYEAEVHWFEAHGVGRVNWKIKGRAT